MKESDTDALLRLRERASEKRRAYEAAINAHGAAKDAMEKAKADEERAFNAYTAAMTELRKAAMLFCAAAERDVAHAPPEEPPAP